jgi:RNA polymerase primary sigma factor
MRALKISYSITKRESRSLAKYLSEISKIDLIPSDEEVELTKKIRNGDEDALQKLVNANLRFVVSVAKQYRDSYLSLNDLINEGNIGLIMAARKFDETKGFKFISYAIWWIRQSILKAISDQSRLIRLPLNRITNLNKLNKTFADLEQQFEREPTYDELSEEMNLCAKEIDETVNTAPRHQSMDECFDAEDELTFHEVVEDTNTPKPDNGMLYADSLKIDTARILESLSSQQREIIEMYFGLGNQETMTLEDIAGKFGVNRERIRQIKEKTLHMIRISDNRNILKEYACQ